MGNHSSADNLQYSHVASANLKNMYDGSFLVSDEYPYALEYTIYGFIREFIEDNYWVKWDKRAKIPREIKILLTKYLKSELIVENGTTVTLSSGVYHQFEHILIKKHGTLTVDPWIPREQKGGKLLLKVSSNITIKEHGKINVDKCGYNGGYFCETGESFCGKGTKNTQNNNGGGGGTTSKPAKYGYKQCRGAGGGYGQSGKDIKYKGKIAKGGNEYGDEYISTLYLGSGGGGGYNNGITQNESGGNGGGAIDIMCDGEIFIKNGAMICANGGSSLYGGGGSGGSIKISCKNITGDDNGVRASGGHDKDNKYAGKGRIRILTGDAAISSFVD